MGGPPNPSLSSLGVLEVYCAYADEDEPLRNALDKHLMNLQRRGLITIWDRHRAVAGTNVEEESRKHLASARVILLLISPDFLASDYAYGVEMQHALERYEHKEAQVIPVHIRPVDWQGSPFADLPCLPRGALAATSWANQDEAFRAIAEGIREVVEKLTAPEAVSPLLPPLGVSEVPLRPSNVSRIDLRIRSRMLQSVRAFWIEGVLNQSVVRTTPLDLAFQEDAGLVANPWRLVLQSASEELAHPLPLDTSILQVYDRAGGQLLILGEPGAGKTTQLLLLARDLLSRAERDESYPLPVVFNLSSWAQLARPLDDWLVEELNVKYQVLPRMARAWVEGDELQLLLDGLDEVAPAYRNACMAAINEYRLQHSSVPVIVCSRNNEYLAQPQRVLLRTAVVVQPLTPVQVDAYLAHAGPSFDGLRRALRADPILQELVTSPLMLNVFMYTYQNQPEHLVGALSHGIPQERPVLESFVEQALRRRSSLSHPPEKMKWWLAWLARQMILRNQVMFSPKQIQVDWLGNGRDRRMYAGLASVLAALLVGGATALIFGLFDQNTGIALISGIVCGFISGCALLFSFNTFLWRRTPRLTKRSRVLRKYAWQVLIVFGFLGGILGGLGFGLLAGNSTSIPKVIVAVLIGCAWSLSYGIVILLQPLLLRLVLVWVGSAPWRYDRFLDEAAERMLLRKTGESYIFYHRSLLEYFATLQPSR